MSAAALPMSYAPPQPGGALPSWALAVLAHLLLLAALTWGISWNQHTKDSVVEAELWSALPQQAAPLPVPPPVAPTPTVQATTTPTPAPTPVIDPQIAIERDKRLEAKRLRDEAKAREQAQLKEQQKRELALKKERDTQQAKKDALEAQKDTQLARQRLEDEKQAKRVQAERDANIRRMQAQAGTSANPAADGTAARASGPSASYAGRIRARIKPNIVFGEDTPGNPEAEVEVRVAPDGTIVARKLLKSSGVKAWDEAVLRAIDKTETLPRDIDGQIPPSMWIKFRPKD